MGRERTPETGIEYDLVSFDAEGAERLEPDGRYSDQVLGRAAATRPTDVFVMSHGWLGDVPAARGQYGRWIEAMAACTDDRDRARARPGGFRPLLVAVHWPSKAWGDEDLGGGSFAAGTTATDGITPADAIVTSAAQVLGDTPEVRSAVRTIIDAALDDAVPDILPPSVRAAYADLDAATGLGAAGEGAPPGEDRTGFDAEAAYQAALIEELASFGGTSFGGLLAPLRVLTFWRMKARAASVGGSGVAHLLTRLQEAAPEARVHLMGHSFGCIVVSAATAAREQAVARRPVHSLALVQGAMSLWSFCERIPPAPDRSGYFHRIVADGLVAGPVIVTTSVHDRAVGTFYPLGAGARGQVDYGPGELPRYGAIGTFGVRGPGLEVLDDDLHAVGDPYDLRPGAFHDLRSDEVISTSLGVMGAHSDITHPPVAHAFWQAALAAGR